MGAPPEKQQESFCRRAASGVAIAFIDRERCRDVFRASVHDLLISYRLPHATLR